MNSRDYQGQGQGRRNGYDDRGYNGGRREDRYQNDDDRGRGYARGDDFRGYGNYGMRDDSYPGGRGQDYDNGNSRGGAR